MKFLYLEILLIFVCFSNGMGLSIKGKLSTYKFDLKPASLLHESLVAFQPVEEDDFHDLFEEPSSTKKFYNIFSIVNDQGDRVLTYYGLMLAGAIARSVAATAVHPLNVMKTMLQCRDSKMPELKWSVLSRGAGAQFLMSIPHGAFSFAVTETTKKQVSAFVHNRKLLTSIPERVLNPLLDFMSSALATFVCSIVSTPQMVITDRIMAGVYSNIFSAVVNIARNEGIGGFYLGWLPAIVQKIPSYALTWMFFQQFKAAFYRLLDREGTAVENTVIGALSASVACSLMIPFDTIKTRIVTQRPGSVKHYDGIIDCFDKILRQEGFASFYRALPPRLLSVVPMTGIQYGVYELMKRLIIGKPPPKLLKAAKIALAKRKQQYHLAQIRKLQLEQQQLQYDEDT